MGNSEMVAGKRYVGTILFGIMFSTALSQSSIFAILPAAGRSIGFTDMQIGALSSLPGLLYVLSAPILGARVARTGERIFLRIGLLSGVITNLVFGVVIYMATEGSLGAKTALALLFGARLLLNLAWGG